MANNIISRELLEQCKRLNDGQSCEICNNFAKKLDRLVEAARKVIVEHPNVRSITKDELTASLREIELPSEVEHGE